MSGIYIHVPFCKTKCNYCDFHKSTDVDQVTSIVDAIEEEMDIRRAYLQDRRVETIYLGGGTPSLLTKEQLARLLAKVRMTFDVAVDAEITLEANPDDLSPEYLKQLLSIGINRLSIGIQSFSDDGLRFMGRRHDAQQAIKAVRDAQEAGFSNLSVDLIYGIPGMQFEQWESNLKQVFELGVQHLSAYHLTFHRGTPFWNQLKKGIFREIDEDESIRQFETLLSLASSHGFIHYETSNFALEGYYSKHNSSYWKQVEYLGLGPSAHSYNGVTRYWNPPNNALYIKSIGEGKPAGKFEELTITDMFNDYLLTGLRTIWGIDNEFIQSRFGDEIAGKHQQNVERLLPSGVIEVKDHRVYITKKGIFISDKIIEELFITTDQHEH